MDLMELIKQRDNAAGLDALAANFGLSRDQVEAVVGAALPDVSQRLERNMLSRGGVADLVAMLGHAHTGLPQIGSEHGLAQGNALLEQMFDTRDGSRAVASRASYATGIGDTVIKAMLPYIIQMVMSAFARRTSGGLGDILSKIPNLGGGPTPAPQGGGGGFGFPTGSGTAGGGSPLPGPQGMPANIPAGSNPYGDLSDIIRKGGSGTNVGGNPLWRIVRSVIGSALGLQSRGIMGWIMRVVVMRYGWSLLGGVLRRMLLRR